MICRSMHRHLPIFFAGFLALAGCAEVPDLMRFQDRTATPNEFTVLPARPLEVPPNTSVLPVPTPGSVDRVVQTPVEDAIVALGGSASAANRSGIPASDTALLAAVSRLGRDPQIRDTLAEEDLDWRRARRPKALEILFGTNLYFRAYSAQSLDQHHEAARLRSAGVRVPAAEPPRP